MTQQQEYQLRKQAADRGYTPQQIQQFIQFAKEKESSPQPTQTPQKEKGEGFLKSLVKGATSSFLRLGAMANAFGTSKVFGGTNANTKPVNLPYVGDVKPITTARDAASVGGDLTLDAIGGEVAGKVVKGVAKGAKALFKTTPEIVDAVAGRAGEAIEAATSTLDEGTKSALNPLRKIPKDILPEATQRLEKNAAKIGEQQAAKQARSDKYIKQAQKAVQDYSQETPLEMAGRKAEEALNILDDKLSKQGQLKSKSLEKIGKLRLPNVAEVRNILRDTLIDRTGTGLSAKGELVQIVGRQSSIPDADLPLVRKGAQRLHSLGSKPTVREVDDTIDYIQGELYKRKGVGAVPVDDKVVSALKKVTGELNSRVKKVAGTSYRTANSKYSYFIDTREALNKALGSEATKGGSLMKRVFSPTDGGTKRLFAEIKKLTGIDLTEEATLAKFAMEKVGDARQASLLEQLQLLKPKGTMGMIESAGKFLLDKAKDPIKEASRIIQEGKLPRP